MPLLGNTSASVAGTFLQDLLTRHLARPAADVVVIDRLHFSHALACRTGLRPFRFVEHLLSRQECLVGCLILDEQAIPERIARCLRERGPDWAAHVRQKGDWTHITGYYAEQQRNLLALGLETSLPIRAFDTTLGDFDAVARQLLDLLPPPLLANESALRQTD